jgi:hypothetical protein
MNFLNSLDVLLNSRSWLLDLFHIVNLLLENSYGLLGSLDSVMMLSDQDNMSLSLSFIDDSMELIVFLLFLKNLDNLDILDVKSVGDFDVGNKVDNIFNFRLSLDSFSAVLFDESYELLDLTSVLVDLLLISSSIDNIILALNILTVFEGLESTNLGVDGLRLDLISDNLCKFLVKISHVLLILLLVLFAGEDLILLLLELLLEFLDGLIDSLSLNLEFL